MLSRSASNRGFRAPTTQQRITTWASSEGAWRLSRLALEIRRARPATRILVIEPNAHPVPEITHTVGESTVEVSAHYLRDRLDLADHLSTAHIRKMGLRMFFSHEGNTDIAQRMELGSSSFVRR